MKNRLSTGLLDVAAILAEVTGPRATHQAALRRAASSAYYALFHTLCQVCGDGLGLWAIGKDDLQLVYRRVEHGKTSDVLAAASTRALHPSLETIAAVFADLRTFRENADYSQPGRLGGEDRLLTRREIGSLIAAARETIAIVDGLPTEVRRRLAILLVTGLHKRHRA